MPDHAAEGVTWFTRDLVLGDEGPDVLFVQRRLGLDQSGVFDESTARAVRGLQRAKGLPMTGKVDKGTAGAVGERARKGRAPSWFSRPLGLGDHGEDVFALTDALGLVADSRFTAEVESAVLRIQSAAGYPLTGVADEKLVVRIDGD